MPARVAGITLLDGEDIQHDLRPRWSKWFWSLIIGLCTLPVGIGIVPLFFVYRARKKTRYLITTDRVIVKKGGWTGTSTEEFQIDQIKRVKSSRGLGERLLGGGTLILDMGADELRLDALPNFSTVKTSIQNAQRA
ncbi:PH domain-containing protein [Halomarina litorea]|uniref:PH domain-containing protein n=1 Tax=Halomarina litorea TaxID=2961595 RepID=UPI0020C4CF54|nr:PH domain-containing protein [Halomarina sp. BCD28]